MASESIDARAAESVADVFRYAANQYPQRPLFDLPKSLAEAYGGQRTSQTYGDVAQRVDELIDCFRPANLTRGDRIALILENRPDFFCHFLALNTLGASIVPIHHEMAADEIGYRLAHSESRAIIALEAHHSLARAACTTENLELTIVRPGEALPALRESAGAAITGPEAEVALLYTSGSTGQPKGCVLSNAYFKLMGEWYVQQGGLCQFDAHGERILTPLPVSHMNALTCTFMAALESASCLIQLDRFHPSSWWSQVRETRASIVHYLGVLPAILLQLPEAPDEDFGDQINFGFGAGVDPRHQEIFEQRFGFPLIEGWAMTETGAGGCIAAHHEPRHVGKRCFGKAPPSLEYRIVDEAGRDVPEGNPGELLVRSAGEDPRRGFFTEYFKDPKATAEVWAGGWFHTGDVVRVDTEGSFYFVDRRKNIIRRSGENIAAVEVEGVLMRNEQVKACAVAPVPDEMRGDEVMACIVTANGTDREAAIAIFERSLDKLAYFKAPGYIAFVDKLPLTSSEKLQRGEVKALCASLCEAGDAHDLRDLKRRPKST